MLNKRHSIQSSAVSSFYRAVASSCQLVVSTTSGFRTDSASHKMVGETKRGTLSKKTTSAPAVRLVSAEYSRSIGYEPSTLKLNSTYGATMCVPASDANNMADRCIQARHEVTRREMVRRAACSIPLESIDAIKAETTAQFDAHTAEQLQTARLRETISQEKATPMTTQSFTTLASTLAAEPRRAQSQVRNCKVCTPRVALQLRCTSTSSQSKALAG